MIDGDAEYDVKDLLYFRIDRKRKLPITTLLYALGYKKQEILDLFYDFKTYIYDKSKKKWKTKFNPENYKAKNFSEEVQHRTFHSIQPSSKPSPAFSTSVFSHQFKSLIHSMRVQY